ncbi:hypothetical protein AWRIB429_0421 [Oenococcus oeni AWRIB429]|uniref:Uncharacterized protein n=1 Tax=Oenococcus oeni AWRIB429 TaxID=655225 RepID=D3L7U1_OENOE|nr:hypothetical protein AWRIB429_0421 [Oenococcus oeni AWRIB429]
MKTKNRLKRIKYNKNKLSSLSPLLKINAFYPEKLQIVN